MGPVFQGDGDDFIGLCLLQGRILAQVDDAGPGHIRVPLGHGGFFDDVPLASFKVDHAAGGGRDGGLFDDRRALYARILFGYRKGRAGNKGPCDAVRLFDHHGQDRSIVGYLGGLGQFRRRIPLRDKRIRAPGEDGLPVDFKPDGVGRIRRIAVQRRFCQIVLVRLAVFVCAQQVLKGRGPGKGFLTHLFDRSILRLSIQGKGGFLFRLRFVPAVAAHAVELLGQRKAAVSVVLHYNLFGFSGGLAQNILQIECCRIHLPGRRVLRVMPAHGECFPEAVNNGLPRIVIHGKNGQNLPRLA